MPKRLGAMLVLCCLLFVGCSPFASPNIGDLLRAPAMGEQQSEIQKALTAYLGNQELQFKFPREGDWKSPILLTDLNGDGRQEAVVLYSVADDAMAAKEKGANAYLAILEESDGGWTVTVDEEGLATEVASIAVAELLSDGSRQLVVGYANSTFRNKSLAVYTYDAAALKQWFTAEYSRYEIGDFTGRGRQDFVMVTRDDQALQMRYLAVDENGTSAGELEAPVPLDTNFVACAAITPSKGPNDEQLLVVDGVVNNVDTGGLASQFVYYSGQRFYTYDDLGALHSATVRQNQLLCSRDIDGDGVVEIPLRVGSGPVETINNDKRLEFVEWVDFITNPQQPETKRFGLFDTDRAVYFRLPDAWRGAVEVVDGEGRGEWILQKRKTGQPLISLQALESGDTEPVGANLLPGTVSTYMVIHRGVSMEEQLLLTMTALADG